MKNYALDKKNAKTFILRYDIKENATDGKIIIVYFASGNTMKIPYNEENEKKILETMKEQVSESDKFVKEAKNNGPSDICKQIGVVSFIMAFLGLPIGITSLTGGIIFFLTFFLASALCIGSDIKLKSRIRDAKKNQLFLDKSHLFFDYNISENVLADVKKSTREVIGNKQQITLNDIDKISYRQVKKLVDSLERETRFSFDYNKPKVKVKKP